MLKKIKKISLTPFFKGLWFDLLAKSYSKKVEENWKLPKRGCCIWIISSTGGKFALKNHFYNKIFLGQLSWLHRHLQTGLMDHHQIWHYYNKNVEVERGVLLCLSRILNQPFWNSMNGYFCCFFVALSGSTCSQPFFFYYSFLKVFKGIVLVLPRSIFDHSKSFQLFSHSLCESEPIICRATSWNFFWAFPLLITRFKFKCFL